MKIADIIAEAITPENRQKIQYLMSRGQTDLATAIQQELGYTDDWDAAAEAAKAKMAAQHSAAPAAKPAPQQQAPQQPQRDRQDTAGRNLKHDRYYRDKKPMPKAADAKNKVQRDFRRGAEIADRFMQ